MKYRLAFAKFVFTLTLSFLALFSFDASASDLNAVLDKTTGTLEDFFQMEVTLENKEHEDSPRVISNDDFEVQYQGQSVSSQWINGVSSRQTTFRFLLEPKRVGTLQSPVIELKVGGTWQRSPSYQITVEKPQIVTDDSQELPAAFVKAEFLPQDVYLNQQATYKVLFFVQSDLRVDELQLQSPQMQDLTSYELEETPTYTQVLQGRRYLVYTHQVAVFPHSTGEKQLLAGKISGKQLFGNNNLFGSFSLFDAKPFRLLIPETTLQVNPLPNQQRPKSFYGLVGNYSLDASLSAEQIQVGEVSTLTIRVQGNGLAESVQAPEIQTTPELKIYRDQPTYQNETNQEQLTGTAEFKIVLSPSRAGDYTIAPVSLNVFHPETGQYQTLTTPALTLRAGGVNPDQVLQDPTTDQGQEAIEKPDLPRPIFRGELAQARSSNTWLIVSLFILPVIGFVLLESIKAYLRYLQSNAQEIRQQKAFQTFQKSLKKQQNLPTDQAQAQWTASCIRQYISDKLMCQAEAFNSAEVQDLLAKQNLDTHLVGQVYQNLLHYEIVCYGGGKLGSHLNLLETMAQLDQALKDMLKEDKLRN